MPATCPCCGGDESSKIGEDVTETLDVVPRQWFVTEHVREKFSCRSSETITQPPAPFHAIPRGLTAASIPSGISPDMPGFSRLTQCGLQHGLQAGAKPGPIIEAGCWAHYLEHIFMWSGRGLAGFWGRGHVT